MPDIFKPYTLAQYPDPGTASASRATPFKYRLYDYGGSLLDATELAVSVSINGAADVVLTNNGVLQDGVGWNASTVRYYSEAPASLADLVLTRDVLHAYGDTIKLTIGISDVDNNASQSVFTYKIRPSPEYTGDAPTSLETLFTQTFDNTQAERLRSSLMSSVVTDPTVNNGPQRSARRILQLTTRLGIQPLVRYWFEEDPDVNTAPVKNAVSLSSLEDKEADLEVLRVDLERYLLGLPERLVERTYLHTMRDVRRKSGQGGVVAACTLLLAFACGLRAEGSL
ncbi:hypothetical protein CMI47_19775 [Candidatus Pacearchaeota archaeon]|nr:hypothetical protein [Candidatus Pacearchaeota archaeon]|tara:strand:+ start:223 stop:1071 length:849 start_codon:yes stop_codon:yes gene_type:complete